MYWKFEQVTRKIRKSIAVAYARGIDFASFYDFNTWFWNCSHSVVFYFFFIFVTPTSVFFTNLKWFNIEQRVIYPIFKKTNFKLLKWKIINVRSSEINIREYRRSNQKRTIQRNWQHVAHIRRRKTKQKHNTICIGHHYERKINTNNVCMKVINCIFQNEKLLFIDNPSHPYQRNNNIASVQRQVKSTKWRLQC